MADEKEVTITNTHVPDKLYGYVNMGVIVTPRSFKNGCYHELADQQQIGWHPNYKQKLKEDEKDV